MAASPGHLHRLASVLSYVLHPAVLMLATVVLISSQMRSSLVLTLMDLIILLAGLLPGLLYIYVRTKRGKFSHYHLLLKEERRIVLPLLLLGMVASFVLFVVAKAPSIMLREMVIGLLAGAGAVVISLFWKISLHSAVAAGCAALFVPFSWSMVVILLFLALLVGVLRLVVRHHTPAQVIGGLLYGFGISSLLVYLLIVSPVV